MPNLFFTKLKRWIQQTLHIKENHWTNQEQVLKRDIEKDIAVWLRIIPTRKAQHPRADI